MPTLYAQVPASKLTAVTPTIPSGAVFVIPVLSSFRCVYAATGSTGSAPGILGY